MGKKELKAADGRTKRNEGKEEGTNKKERMNGRETGRERQREKKREGGGKEMVKN